MIIRMDIGFTYLIIAALAFGILSLVVAVFMIRNEKSSKYLIKYGTPFAAGVLLIAAFRDLLPQGIEEEGVVVLNSTLFAIVFFFLIEKGFKSFHHHHEEDLVGSASSNKTQGWLFLTGDVFHNFIDGISLGGAFLLGTEVGIVATIALIAHDIPLEVGEFGLQLQAGFTKKQTIIRNLATSLMTLVGAVFSYLFASNLDLQLGILYGGIAGFFIYIALSDIVPTIHSSEKSRYGMQTLFLVVGLVFGYIVGEVAHQYIG